METTRTPVKWETEKRPGSRVGRNAGGEWYVEVGVDAPSDVYGPFLTRAQAVGHGRRLAGIPREER